VDFLISISVSISDPSPCPEAVDFLCFPQKPCTPMLNFFARSGPEIEKIDSLWTGRGILKSRERENAGRRLACSARASRLAVLPGQDRERE
jgi:hypothetical protein